MHSVLTIDGSSCFLSWLTEQQHNSGSAVRIRFGTEMSDTRGSSSSIGSASAALKPLAEVAEAGVEDGVQDEDDEDDDVWSDTPVTDAEEGTAEDVTHKDSKASDAVIPEPAGLKSDFRFDLNDMKVDKILGTVFKKPIPSDACSVKCSFLTTPRSIDEQSFKRQCVALLQLG
jgi:hypothetical protein